MTYRITNPEPGLFVPAVRKGSWPFLRWVNLDGAGRELAWGSRWSGPLGVATFAVSVHGSIDNVVVMPFEETLNHG